MTKDNFYNSKEFKDNLRKYEDAEKNGCSTYLESDELTDIAEYYNSKGELDKAIKVIDYAISLFPGATTPLIFRTRISLLVNNDSERAEYFISQIEDKTDLDYYYIKAEIMIVNDKTDEADAYLDGRFKDVDDDDCEDFIIDVATLFADYDVMDKAQKWLALSENKDADDNKELQGRIEMSKGNFKESERIFNELLDRDPYSGPHWNQLASSQYMANNIQESITSSEFSIAINPDDEEAILNKANGLFFLGNVDEAMKYYKRLATLRPYDETGEMFQGITLIKLNRLQEAVIHLQKAAELAKNQPVSLLEIYQTLAYTMSSLGHSDQALGYITKAEALENVNQNELMVLRGHVCLEQGDQIKAQEYFQKAIDDSDSSPQIILRTAISIYDNGYVTQSYNMLNTLLSVADEEWTDGYAYLASCCKELNKEDEYAEALKKACEKNPDEVKSILGENFPQDLDRADYYDYIINNK